MNLLKKPKYIALDSSIINNLANDFFSGKSKRKLKAEKFLTFINGNDFVPVLSFEHIEEIIQHSNINLAEKSISILKHFRHLAWIKSHFVQVKIPGNIHDIIAEEIAFCYSEPQTKYNNIINQVKSTVYQFGSGKEFVNTYENILFNIRPFLPILQKKNRK